MVWIDHVNPLRVLESLQRRIRGSDDHSQSDGGQSHKDTECNVHCLGRWLSRMTNGFNSVSKHVVCHTAFFVIYTSEVRGGCSSNRRLLGMYAPTIADVWT